jgi:Fe2+ transport system protein FeoA
LSTLTVAPLAEGSAASIRVTRTSRAPLSRIWRWKVPARRVADSAAVNGFSMRMLAPFDGMPAKPLPSPGGLLNRPWFPVGPATRLPDDAGRASDEPGCPESTSLMKSSCPRILLVSYVNSTSPHEIADQLNLRLTVSDHPIILRLHTNIESLGGCMCLTDLERGDCATVVGIQGEHLRVQLLRFGITAGSTVEVGSRLPFGPVVLRHGGIEVALGREAAREVEVRPSSRTGRNTAGTETRR